MFKQFRNVALLLSLCLILGSTEAKAGNVYPYGYLGSQLGYGSNGYYGWSGYGAAYTNLSYSFIGNGWGWRSAVWNRSLGYNPAPPYFATNPPVYYAYPKSRTYGISPYPWAPGLTSRSCQSAVAPRQKSIPTIDLSPRLVKNPYVKSKDEKFAKYYQAKVQPLVIHNPYVKDQVAASENL